MERPCSETVSPRGLSLAGRRANLEGRPHVLNFLFLHVRRHRDLVRRQSDTVGMKTTYVGFRNGGNFLPTLVSFALSHRSLELSIQTGVPRVTTPAFAPLAIVH